MNGIGSIVGRIFCSGPFSFALGFGIGVFALYLLERSKEKKRFEETYKETEALLKALEVKLKEKEAEV